MISFSVKEGLSDKKLEKKTKKKGKSKRQQQKDIGTIHVTENGLHRNR